MFKTYNLALENEVFNFQSIKKNTSIPTSRIAKCASSLLELTIDFCLKNSIPFFESTLVKNTISYPCLVLNLPVDLGEGNVKIVFSPHYLLENCCQGFYLPEQNVIGISPEILIHDDRSSLVHEIVHFRSRNYFLNEPNYCLYGFFEKQRKTQSLDEPIALYEEAKYYLCHNKIEHYHQTIWQAHHLNKTYLQQINKLLKNKRNNSIHYKPKQSGESFFQIVCDEIKLQIFTKKTFISGKDLKREISISLKQLRKEYQQNKKNIQILMKGSKISESFLSKKILAFFS